MFEYHILNLNGELLRTITADNFMVDGDNIVFLDDIDEIIFMIPSGILIVERGAEIIEEDDESELTD